MWYSSKITSVENRCKPVFMTLKLSTATNYLPCCCTPRVLAASTCFFLFCIISMPSVHNTHAWHHSVNVPVWVSWIGIMFLLSLRLKHLFGWKQQLSNKWAPQTQSNMSTFFSRQNELSFKQKVCFTCFLPKFCMRHLLNGLASHLLLSSPLPFSRALLTSAVKGVTSGMKVQNDSCLNLTFIFLFPNISHQIAP